MSYELCDAPKNPQTRIDEGPARAPARRDLGALPYDEAAAKLKPPTIVSQQTRTDGSVLTKYSDGHTELAQPNGRGMSLPAPSAPAPVPQPCLDPMAQAETMRRFRAAQNPSAPDVVADRAAKDRRHQREVGAIAAANLAWRRRCSGAVESDPIQPLDLLIPGKLAYGLYSGGTQGLLHAAKHAAVEKGTEMVLERGAEALHGGHHAR